MSRIGITYQAVEAAASQLQGLGKNPTVDRIREILGTGSKTTIARHLRAWHEQLPQSDSKNVPAELMSMVSGLWIQLQEKAAQQVTELQHVCEEKIALIFAQQAQNESEIKMLQGTVNQLELMLSEETKTKQKLQDELLVKEAEKNRIIHRSNTLENSLNDQKSENEKLYLLFSNVQKNMEHYQMAMQQLQQEQSIAMDNQKHQYEKALKELQQRLSVESTDRKKLIIQLEQNVSEFKKQLNRISELETNLKEKEIGEALFRDRYENLVKQSDKNMRKLEHIQQALICAQEKNALDANQITSLMHNLELAQQKIDLLQQQCSLLSQEKAHLEGRLELKHSHQV